MADEGEEGFGSDRNRGEEESDKEAIRDYISVMESKGGRNGRRVPNRHGDRRERRGRVAPKERVSRGKVVGKRPVSRQEGASSLESGRG